MALTSKKRAFIVAVREGASNKDAAIAAGCSAKTASAAGSRLAKDPDVVSELHKLNALFPLGTAVKGNVKADVKPARAKLSRGSAETAPELEEEAERLPELSGELPPPEPVRLYTDPRDYLLDDMNDPTLDRKDRRDAAKALMPFLHARKGEGGKKEERQKAAEKVASKFSRQAPPKLVAANGKQV
jgi:phage terminase small subunit